MKYTNTSLKIALILVSALFLKNIYSQDYPCTVIDVNGSRYGDTMWLFTVEGTTNTYDNGWDGLKMFGSTSAPQIFAVGTDYFYQVYTSSDINNTIIGFIPGEDSTYTFKFTHYNVSSRYPALYLIDKVENRVENVISDGYRYTFNARKTDLRDRFEIVSDYRFDQDTTEVKPKNPNKGKGFNSGKPKNIPRIFFSGDNMVVDNSSGGEVVLKLFDVYSGSSVGCYNIEANVIRLIKTELRNGNYILTIVDKEMVYSCILNKN
jgi:hypothetical protein